MGDCNYHNDEEVDFLFDLSLSSEIDPNEMPILNNCCTNVNVKLGTLHCNTNQCPALTPELVSSIILSLC